MVTPQSVIKAGPTNFQRLAGDDHTLRSLEHAYSKAIQDILYLALGAIAASLPFALGMEWKNLKTSIQKKQATPDPKVPRE